MNSMILNNAVFLIDVDFDVNELSRSTELPLDIHIYSDINDLFQDFKRALDIELNNELNNELHEK